MSQNGTRFSITMSDDLFREVERFRYENQYKTQTKAVADLIQRGIDALLNPQDAPQDLPRCTHASAKDDHIKKYRTLDEYGKKAVDAVLDIEYERCQQNSGNLLVAARGGQRVKANRVDNLDELLPSKDTNNI